MTNLTKEIIRDNKGKIDQLILLLTARQKTDKDLVLYYHLKTVIPELEEQIQ